MGARFYAKRRGIAMPKSHFLQVFSEQAQKQTNRSVMLIKA
jgi:hypothetical protein